MPTQERATGIVELDEPGILLIQHKLTEDIVEYAIRAAKDKGWNVILNPAPARSNVRKLAFCQCSCCIISNQNWSAGLTRLARNEVEEFIAMMNGVRTEKLGTVLI
jgi:sugar/nucleoside kinase (ribokinase family)